VESLCICIVCRTAANEAALLPDNSSKNGISSFTHPDLLACIRIMRVYYKLLPILLCELAFTRFSIKNRREKINWKESAIRSILVARLSAHGGTIDFEWRHFRIPRRIPLWHIDIREISSLLAAYRGGLASVRGASKLTPFQGIKRTLRCTQKPMLHPGRFAASLVVERIRWL